jgi:hypothetical protein
MDPVVQYAHSRKIKLVLDLQTCDFDVPQSAALLGGGYRTNTQNPTPPTCAPNQIDAAVAAWQALAARYAPGGQFANSMGWTDGYGVTDFEIENEPNSFPWWGSYASVPKDYALYLSKLVPAIKVVDPQARIIAPALAQEGGPFRSQVWLDEMLSTNPTNLQWASDQYRSAVAAGAAFVGGGPYIDDYSYHEDMKDPAGTDFSTRPSQLRQVILKYSNQASYPASATPSFWFTEGGPNIASGTSYSAQLRYTHAEAQYALETLGGGASHLAIDFSVNNGDSDATFALEPDPLMASALVTYFPSGTGYSDTSSAVSSLAGKPVVSYTWTNPVTGLRSIAMWAQDLPSGSGATGSPFAFSLPVKTTRVAVVGQDWSQQIENVNGTVPVTLQSADPSGMVIVAELNTTSTSCREADGDGRVNRTDSTGGTHQATFHFDKDACEDNGAEVVAIQDPASGTNFQSAQLTSVTYNDILQTITIMGTGIDASIPVTFMMVAGHTAPAPDWFSIALSDGYAVNGSLLSGAIES